MNDYNDGGMITATARMTTAARRMCREVNGSRVVPGCIYEIDLATGRVGAVVARYAAHQVPQGHSLFGKIALWRVSYGHTTQKQCQAFIDAKGVGY